MVQHAFASEDKEARRNVILKAACALFITGGGTLPSAARIAAAAGLAKGTVYLYFRTKEEIFLALLLEACLDALNEIETTFKNTKGNRGAKVAAFLTSYAGHLDQHPELLRLDSLCYSVLEKNLAPDKLREFKLTFAARLTETAATIEQALRLSAGHGVPLLTRTFALTRGLWQSSASSHECSSRKNGPLLPILHPEFNTELTEALTEYWRGALASV